MSAHSREIEVQRLIQLGEEVRRIASSLIEPSISHGNPNSQLDGIVSSGKPNVSEEVVRGLIHARHERRRYLPSELFADPAWDMLLDLLQAEIVHRRVSISSLSTVSELPATTGLRWIQNMVEQGVLIRRPDPFDGRRVFVELAPEISGALRRYFLDVVQVYRER